MSKISISNNQHSQIKRIEALMSITLFTTIMVSTFTAQAEWCFFSCKNEAIKNEVINSNPSHTLLLANESPQEAQSAVEALRLLAASMTSQIAEIEPLIGSKENSFALNKAKSALDEVRVKSGIDPKAKLRENLLISLTFPEYSNSMTTLPNDQQQIIIRTVQDYKGGLYLDIINLTKRISLLYIKALHAQFKVNGGLTREDRNKILNDLATSSNIPIPIQDKNGKVITVFDEEVANEDHIYMFNREITNYLYNANDLNINEDQFVKHRSDLKLKITGTTPRAPISSKDILNKIQSCYNTASLFVSYIDIENYKRTCFNTYKFSIDRKTCIDMAIKFISVEKIENGKHECINQFGY